MIRLLGFLLIYLVHFSNGTARVPLLALSGHPTRTDEMSAMGVKADMEQLEAGMLIYDALYRWARDAVDEAF